MSDKERIEADIEAYRKARQKRKAHERYMQYCKNPHFMEDRSRKACQWQKDNRERANKNHRRWWEKNKAQINAKRREDWRLKKQISEVKKD